MKTQSYVQVHPVWPKGSTSIVTYPSVVTNLESSLAMDLARDMAIVAAAPDGEDSHGRSKLRLLTPQEVASRACSIASAMVEQFVEKGWLEQLPEPTYVPEPGEDEGK